MMQQLSAAGRTKLADIAQRHGFSTDAVSRMLASIGAGHGRMAQFADPEFGGSGQWMRGGMTMIADMFDADLKARVDSLCNELATLLSSDANINQSGSPMPDDDEQRPAPSGTGPRAADAGWWPAELGQPDSAGSQNAVRYAYFAGPRRLAIDADGGVTIYDTLDHRISGVSQQQSTHGSVTFSSADGDVDVATLPVVTGT